MKMVYRKIRWWWISNRWKLSPISNAKRCHLKIDELRNRVHELEERLEGEIEKVRVRDLVIRHSRPDIIRAIAESSNYPDGPAATKVRNAYYYPSTYDTVINEGQLENILAKNITT
jgi:hypothetical protein